VPTAYQTTVFKFNQERKEKNKEEKKKKRKREKRKDWEGEFSTSPLSLVTSSSSSSFLFFFSSSSLLSFSSSSFFFFFSFFLCVEIIHFVIVFSISFLVDNFFVFFPPRTIRSEIPIPPQFDVPIDELESANDSPQDLDKKWTELAMQHFQ
jgi:hypothetical protein